MKETLKGCINVAELLQKLRITLQLQWLILLQKKQYLQRNFKERNEKRDEINSRNEKFNANSANIIRKMILSIILLDAKKNQQSFFQQYIISKTYYGFMIRQNNRGFYFYALVLIPPLLEDDIPIFLDEAGISVGIIQAVAWILHGEILSKDCPTNSKDQLYNIR